MKRFNLSRRTFLKAAMLGAACAAVGGTAAAPKALAETSQPNSGSVRHIRTACRGCGKMECGVWVTVENGRVVRIEGDDSAWGSTGNCCSKSQSSIQAAYHPDRLTYPMVRTTERGADDPGWRRASWDEAIELMCKSITSIQEKYDKNSLMQMCGTSRIWANTASRGLGSFFGTLNMHAANQICKGPRREAGSLTIQNGMHFMANVDRPKVYVQWGTDQTQSNYDDSCRTIVEVVHDADTFISIDPRKGNCGKEAGIHLALRPGSDHALACGWTNIVMDKDLYDDYLVKYWSNAPFLICEEIEPTGWGAVSYNADPTFSVSTCLLKESDLIEGGDVHRFMVWNAATNSLTYFDATETIGLWEGQTEHDIPTTGFEFEYGGWVPDHPVMPENLDPALWCGDGYEVTLKDGRTVKVKTVWQTYWDDCISEWTPEKTAETCDLDANELTEACVTWATRIDPRYGNGGLNAQLAPEQSGRSIQTFRTIYLLAFMTDNYDTPGGNRGVTRSNWGSSFPPYNAPKPKTAPKSNWDTRERMCGTDKFPMTRWWDAWTDATSIWDAAHTGKPYPVKACMCVSGDFMNQSNATYAWEALLQMEHIVVVDLWHTPTAQIADVLLPCCHWLEVPGFMRTSQGSSGHIGLHQQCTTPPGEALFEGEIVCKMYKYMDVPFYDPEKGDPWDQSYSVALDNDARKTGIADTWDELCGIFQEHGWWSAKEIFPEDWGTYRRFTMGYERNPDASSTIARAKRFDGMPGMKTPTMKCEFWSTITETFLPGQGQEMPKYLEPPLSPVSTPELFEEYPFNMTTGRRIPVYFHSEHRQLPWCRELWPVPRCEINPDDAAQLGIEQGDWIWIESKWGKIRQTADLFYGVKPGVINCEHQWWFPECKSASKGFELCNINCLVNKDAQDPICGSSQLRAYPVKVYKATPENCPDGKVIPTDSTGVEIISSPDDPRLKEWLPVYEGRE